MHEDGCYEEHQGTDGRATTSGRRDTGLLVHFLLVRRQRNCRDGWRRKERCSITHATQLESSKIRCVPRSLVREILRPADIPVPVTGRGGNGSAVEAVNGTIRPEEFVIIRTGL